MSMVDLSVVIPTKNEEISIEKFIHWVKEGALKTELSIEIILIDNSIDDTPNIARRLGATVVSIEERGLGLAYLKSKQYVRGKYVLLGDADCTYDFRNIQPFIQELEKGFDFVIGNRFKGRIQKGAMPLHHQYFGSPLTSLWFKFLLGIPTGDIHCGLRAMTREVFLRLPFNELGWEYASEMIVAARNTGARIKEIPIDFLKEPDGRISHHRRDGWLTPFKAGWGTLRVTWMHSFDRLFKVFGTPLMVFGTISLIAMTILPLSTLTKISIGTLTLFINALISIVGISLLELSSLVRYFYRDFHFLVARKISVEEIKSSFNFWAFVSSTQTIFSIILVLKWTQEDFSELNQDSFRFLGLFLLHTVIWYLATILFFDKSTKKLMERVYR